MVLEGGMQEHLLSPFQLVSTLLLVLVEPLVLYHQQLL
jgi:hypothetical protein